MSFQEATATGPEYVPTLPTSLAHFRELLPTYADNFKNQAGSTFSRMSAKDWIRLTIIICGYALLRRYIMIFGAKAQARAHEKANAENQANGRIDPNDLRQGRAAIPGMDIDEDEEDETEVQAGDWGRKAVLRQRKFVRDMMEAEERRLQDMQATESDEEIADLLED